MFYWIFGGVFMVAAAAAGGYLLNNITYFKRSMTAVYRAGFVEKQATINGSRLNYAEGPANGPALLLIHGQAVDWQNYANALPALAAHYHVFAVDCYGHGRSDRAPEKYTLPAMGADLAQFINAVIGDQAIVCGHSSGGLLAAWLAAYKPERVQAVVLEDPPFFTTLLPRARQTWNYVDLATTAHNFLAGGADDFVVYNVRHGKLFALFQGLQPRLIQRTVAARTRHPDRPVRIPYLPPVMNEMLRGLHTYDPRFGDAFYDGSWNGDVDHAEMLAGIGGTAVLIHANWEVDADGILRAAMNDNDAERARSLLQNVEFHRVDSGHGFHFEKPRAFTQILLALREEAAS